LGNGYPNSKKKATKVSILHNKCENEMLMDKSDHIKRYAAHMSRIGVFFSLASLAMLSWPAQASDVSGADGVIKGREYHEDEKIWIPRDIRIFIAIDEKGKKYYLFQAETSLGGAFVVLDKPQEVNDRLESIVSKAIDLSQISKESRVDKVIYLGCFSPHTDSPCRKDIVSYTVAYKENEISFRFIARNSGQQTELVIDLVDRSRISCRATIHLNEEGMLELFKAITKVRRILEQARAAQPVGGQVP
jgi:hypothetical protein